MDALFRQAGVIRAASLEELVDVATLLSTQPAPRGRGVAVLTNAGGLGIMCADACEAAGLTLPPLAEETRTRLQALLPAEASLHNPVDMLGSATAALVRGCAAGRCSPTPASTPSSCCSSRGERDRGRSRRRSRSLPVAATSRFSPSS